MRKKNSNMSVPKKTTKRSHRIYKRIKTYKWTLGIIILFIIIIILGTYFIDSIFKQSLKTKEKFEFPEYGFNIYVDFTSDYLFTVGKPVYMSKIFIDGIIPEFNGTLTNIKIIGTSNLSDGEIALECNENFEYKQRRYLIIHTSSENGSIEFLEDGLVRVVMHLTFNTEDGIKQGWSQYYDESNPTQPENSIQIKPSLEYWTFIGLKTATFGIFYLMMITGYFMSSKALYDLIHSESKSAKENLKDEQEKKTQPARKEANMKKEVESRVPKEEMKGTNEIEEKKVRTHEIKDGEDIKNVEKADIKSKEEIEIKEGEESKVFEEKDNKKT